MDIYGWVVFVHAATILLFFVAHGTSMAVAFKLKNETDPARVRALLDLSAAALGVPTGVLAGIGLLTGIAAGFLGGHWGSAWIWMSLIIFVVVAGAMTPIAAVRLGAIRRATAGVPADGATEAVEPDPIEMQRLIDAWNPVPVAAMGLGAFLVILWLMLVQPF